jgi:hypothetical protein
MHSPIHAAAYALDPEFHEVNPMDNPEIKKGFMIMVDRLCKEVVTQAQVEREFMAYAQKTGHFSRATCWVNAREISAHSWWDMYGNETPALQALAVKVLSQCSSSSSCERNWSTFDFIHSKKRNRLNPTTTRKLVFVHQNLKLLDKISVVGYKEEKIEWETSSDDES